ncbi:hypothetical protein LCGC14_0919380, partial [marine sediment metagenome]
PKLKKMLHGTIEANSQHVVTQAGATSLFAGVNSWSGAQARYPQFVQNAVGGRFRQYNQTQLVKSTKANGSADLGPGAGAAEAMYAGAIMRLPYPANPAMLAVGNLYHDPTMEWDLDPGREGAGSGYLCVAPGYWGGLSVLDQANGLHYDQFVNSISPLATSGSILHQDFTSYIPACAFQPDSAASGHVYSNVSNGWDFGANDTFSGDAALPFTRGMVPLLVATHVINIDATDLDAGGVLFLGPSSRLTGAGTIGTYFDDIQTYAYTAPFTLDGATDVLLCTIPGTAAQYLYRTTLDAYPMLRIDMGNTATAVTRSLRSSFVIQDGPSQHGHNNAGGNFNETRAVDTIWLPFGSSSRGTLSSTTPDQSSSLAASSLRGRVVQYPDSWGAATETALEALWVASVVFRAGYGRGLYLGTTTTRYNAPMMVPGSGTPLFTISRAENVQAEQTAQPPDQYPVASSAPPFAPSVRFNAKHDHGGPVAYSLYGTIINPSNEDYRGQAIMQISGGPTGPRNYASAVAPLNNSDQLDGTALDAFFPSKRPLLRTK